jgi:hypothetical protein
VAAELPTYGLAAAGILLWRFRVAVAAWLARVFHEMVLGHLALKLTFSQHNQQL